MGREHYSARRSTVKVVRLSSIFFRDLYSIKRFSAGVTVANSLSRVILQGEEVNTSFPEVDNQFGKNRSVFSFSFFLLWQRASP